MKKSYLKFFVLLLLLFCGSVKSFATHIRAGEITAERVNCQSRTFRFTLTAYTDTRSPVSFGNGQINFGDGTPSAVLNEIRQSYVTSRIGEEGDFVAVHRYTFTHTYPSNGDFIISYQEMNRNPNVLNMANSIYTPFYIETKIVLDPYIGCNNTPVLLIPPIDKAAIGVKYMHNPGAFDIDGDSLSYKLVINQKDKGQNVDLYVYPNNPRFGGTTEDGSRLPIFTLDPVYGELLWDAPGTRGEYNCAIVVEEWRKIDGEYFNLGYVTRDMQILVEDTENERPEIITPADTCIEAGTKLEAIFRAQDPDGDYVRIETYGGPYELASSPAIYSPRPFPVLPSPAIMNMEWQTNCSHVQERPYTFHVKAIDYPSRGPSLVDFKVWNVTVVAPAPKGLQANVAPGRAIDLEWDAYQCGNAEKMQVWRRVGSFDFDPEGCEIGMPEYAGYKLIAEVPINVSEFRDDNDGEGLNVGANYCYRLVAVFAQPGGGESYASEEICDVMGVTAPAITNVSVENTSQTDGEILVKWTPPYDIDEALFPPPYTYELVRSRGFAPSSNETVLVRTSDTLFVDTGLNTVNDAYNYTVRMYDDTNSETSVISSATASSVYLGLRPMLAGMELSWSFNVPWNNSSADCPMHYIYRDQIDPASPEDMFLIDSVDVVNLRSFRYVDDGSFNDQPLSDMVRYNYFITAQGSYENSKILHPLQNKSQIAGGYPNDTIPPCAPISFTLDQLEDCREFVKNLSCGFDMLQNRLTWNVDLDESCDDDIMGHNIYFSPTGEEGTFELIGLAVGTEFLHENLTSLAGCYMISAVDRSGNESELTEKICIDNCPYFELPNVFTPGTVDQKNDVFAAYPNELEHCPRFVKSVNFRVYNRWGQEVYSFQSGGENTIYINWDGNSNNGSPLPGGTYYYVADVEFVMLNPDNGKKTYNGWVKLLR